MFKWWCRSSSGYTGGLRVSVDGPRNQWWCWWSYGGTGGMSGNARGRRRVV